MEWLSCLNEAINYMEEHLEDEIDLERVAQIARCSSFHFQRMFSYLADLPLSEYIRRRKMTRAVFDLQNSDEKIIHIGLKYGYESPTAFNRAFQSVHGMAPSVARAEGVTLKAYPPISFKITIKGEAEMNYRIEKKSPFKIAGVREHYSMNIEDSFAKVPLFWQKTAQSGVIPRLCTLMNREPKGILGVSTCMNGKDFDYYIAVATDQETPEEMAEYHIPECTWAIFECIGAMPEAIQNLQKRIVSEWLPNSGYEYANAPDIEVYFEGNQQAEDYRCEVWLPVEKKQ
ncbi:AraC family transcriptional regulator [Desulfosporosinus lacus]|uniref:AraC family transcriptional regulator n=1 Tax=Desulfosporosinus lacus DSM 15449 TaxID=1121420 RepID=A0A1M6D388_9FIRM|nr:AraC family transcriptional regulator [Desulfosporosinus lacus]SHI67742.1 AraC family transcriptional regulator [Desulfosporosinus lacus DSM 15449]